MRALTTSEKRLGLFLGLALFVMVNLFLFTHLTRRTAEARQQTLNLDAAQIEAAVWMEEKDLWNERLKWLDANQPAVPADGSAGSSLLESLQSEAGKSGVKILSQSLAEPVTSPVYQEYAVNMRVTATLEQLARWLTAVQQPKQFQAVTNFTLKSDKEPPTVICDLRIARYYKPTASPDGA